MTTPRPSNPRLSEATSPSRFDHVPYLSGGSFATGTNLKFPPNDTLGWINVMWQERHAVSPPVWYVRQHPGCWLFLAAGFTAAEIMSGNIPDEPTAAVMASLRGYDLGFSGAGDTLGMAP